MCFEEIKDWAILASTVITALSTIFGIGFAAYQYKLKASAERRLAESSKVEKDIQLVKVFTELMEIAHSRRGSSIASDKIFEVLLANFSVDSKDTDKRVELIKDLAVINLPYGKASQDAAIVAIFQLGKKHQILSQVALQALKSICEFKPDIAKPLLENLQSYLDAQNIELH
jgi:hypothetical protein